MNDHGGFLPFGPVLEEVDHCGDEGLFVERIGIAGVAVLESLRFQEADRRKIAGVNGVKEIMRVIFMIRLTIVSDFVDRSWPCVTRVQRRRVILEERMVRYVVVDCCRRRRSRHRGSIRQLECQNLRIHGASSAASASVRVRHAQVKSAHERTPGHTIAGQHVADIPAGHLKGAGLRRANVVEGITVANQCEASVTISHFGGGAGAGKINCDSIRLAGNKIDHADGGRAVLRAERIVVHRKMLRVIPQGGDGVSVKIAHVQALGENDCGRRVWWCALRAGGNWIQVDKALMQCGLFICIRVALAARQCLAAIQTERIGGVHAVAGRVKEIRVIAAKRVVLQIRKRGGNSVDGGSALRASNFGSPEGFSAFG